MHSQNDTQLIGVDIDKTGVALAIPSVQWRIPGEVLASPLARKTFGSALLNTKPLLIARNVGNVVYHLSRLLEYSPGEYNQLVDLFQHDLTELSYSTGVLTPKLPANESALDATTVGPQLVIDAPRYYAVVGYPNLVASLKSQWGDDNWMGGMYTCKVVYSDLLLRVLAHYTHDPTLIRVLQEQPNPLRFLTSLLELKSPQELLSMLTWMAVGEDPMLMENKALLAELPEKPQYVKHSVFDKHLPVLRLSLSEKYEEVRQQGQVMTLYGRRVVEAVPSVLLKGLFFGGIQDLVAVATASFRNLGLITSPSPWDGEGSTRLRFTGYINSPDVVQLEADLTELAQLSQPLIVPLDAKVTVE